MDENHKSKVIESVQHPIIRALMQLVPGGIGSAVDVLLNDRVQLIQKERVRHFFEQLGKGKQSLTPELIASDDFLHCFFNSIRAAQRTRYQEKINLFANLLYNSAICNNIDSSIDDFEENLSIIEDLSFREWRAILLYDGLIKKKYSNVLNGDISIIWKDILEILEHELGLPGNETVSFLHRISRSGLLGQVGGFFTEREWLVPTAKFDRIKSIVAENFKSQNL